MLAYPPLSKSFKIYVLSSFIYPIFTLLVLNINYFFFKRYIYSSVRGEGIPLLSLNGHLPLKGICFSRSLKILNGLYNFSIKRVGRQSGTRRRFWGRGVRALNKVLCVKAPPRGPIGFFLLTIIQQYMANNPILLI